MAKRDNNSDEKQELVSAYQNATTEEEKRRTKFELDEFEINEKASRLEQREHQYLGKHTRGAARRNGGGNGQNYSGRNK